MEKVLVAAFGPFGGESMNPALEAVRLLPGSVAGVRLVRIELPVSYERAPRAVEEALLAERPDVVLCAGQAGGRAQVSIERVAVNLADAVAPDVDGCRPCDEPLVADAPAALFATVPTRRMVQAVRDAGLPAQLSYSAGTFVCNATLFRLLWMLEREAPAVRAGFVHVPFAPEQLPGKPAGTPAMPVEDAARALEAAIAAAL